MTALEIIEKLAENLQAEFKDVKAIYIDDVKHIDEPCFSIELVSYSNSLFSADKVFKSLDLDILYFGASSSEWLAIAEKVIALLLPSTQVNSRVLTPLSYPKMLYYDHIGHILVKYEWLDDLLERSKEAQDLNMIHDNNEYIPRLRDDEKMQIIHNDMKGVK